MRPFFSFVRRKTTPCGRFPVRATKIRSARAVCHPVRPKIVLCDGISLRAPKNRFPPPEIRFVRVILRSVRPKLAPCGRFPFRATIFQSGWALSRSVRPIFPSVRPKTRPCGDFPICAGKSRFFDRLTQFRCPKNDNLTGVTARNSAVRRGIYVVSRLLAKPFSRWSVWEVMGRRTAGTISPSAVDGLPDIAGVFENDLSWSAGVAGHRSEFAGKPWDWQINCRITRHSEVQRPLVLACRRDDSDDWAGSGR